MESGNDTAVLTNAATSSTDVITQARRPTPAPRPDPKLDARRAADLGFVTQVVSDQDLLATASETARKLAAKPASALQTSKRLMKQLFRDQIKAAMKVENEEFSAQVRSEDAKEAFRAFLEKRPPDFTRTMKSAAPA